MSSKGPSMFQRCSMEFFSCFLIVFTIQNSGTKFYGIFSIALSFFIGVFIAAKVSGAHLNPAVTFMAYLNDAYKSSNTSFTKTYLPYMFSQTLGSLLGGMLSDVLGGETVHPAISDVSLGGAFISEGFFTFFLCLGVSVIADPNSGMDPAMCGLVVCSIIYITATSIGPFTSGVVNPAIGIALTLSSWVIKGVNDSRLLPLYIIAPLFGAYAAHFVYVRTIKPAMQPQEAIYDD